MHIGPYNLTSRVLLAPMAGVTDLPYRRICRALGAGLVTGEMLTANAALWDSPKSQRRRVLADEPGPRAVQIAGAEPAMLADAARRCVDEGAQIVDINMGCPAKKVCNKAAGSALLRDEALVADILRAVVATVRVPVTLKIRTGWSPDARNGVRIARIAADCGIAALTVHGRTRACRFEGAAEYDTIAAIKQSVRIPVIANGDIDSPDKAARVLAHTGADGVMIGRAALGNPWVFRAINRRLAGLADVPPTPQEMADVLLGHLAALYTHYGDYMGVRVARKHVGWYLDRQSGWDRATFNALAAPHAQLAHIDLYFQGRHATAYSPATHVPAAPAARQGELAA
jgi:tRNA-dihydrouridine synthase B